MKAALNVLMLAALLGGSAFAAEKTWTGSISDSKCGAKHMAGEHGAKMSARDCTEGCIKGGAKYVFVSKGKVYNIDNQDYAGLAEHAGHTVKLTGEMTGDTIKVSNVVMPGGKKKKT
ncbi:MAG TPA: hypothetical protein DEQ47_02895 [Solibacterales bacterium]|nr:hypothetical protein [Bryobacterales bacterium]